MRNKIWLKDTFLFLLFIGFIFPQRAPKKKKKDGEEENVGEESNGEEREEKE